MVVIRGKTLIDGEDVTIVLAEPCDGGHPQNIGTAKKPVMITSHQFCGRCNGTGEKLTKAGQTLIDFVRAHGEFAREDHWHSGLEEL